MAQIVSFLEGGQTIGRFLREALLQHRTLSAALPRLETQHLGSPVYLIAGGTEDGVVPADIARFAADLLPAGELLEMPGCGHAPFIEGAPTYLSALNSFLQGLNT